MASGDIADTIHDPYGVLGGGMKASDLAALMAEARSHGSLFSGMGGDDGTRDILGAMTSYREVPAKVTPPELPAAPAEVIPVDGLSPIRKPRSKTGNLKTGKIKQRKAIAEPSPEITGVSSTSEDNVCPRCSARMRVQELEYKCEDCGFIVEGDSTAVELPDDDGGTRKPLFAGRLRIVGPNSGFYQPDLDRSSNADNEAAQHKQILEEFMTYRQRYIEKTGHAFPINALERAASHYHNIQKKVVKRSINKKSIMAACLRYGCAEIDYAPDKHEFAAMLQLKTRGIARGDNFVRMMKAGGHIEIEVNKDMIRPNTMTAFSLLQLDDDKYEFLRKAVKSIVEIATKENIGTSSIVRSKVMGATYVVLRRYELTLAPGISSRGNSQQSRLTESKKPVPKKTDVASKLESKGTSVVIPSVTNLTMQEFCDKCKIRKSTIERFTVPLSEFHSYFADVYRAAGIYDRALPE